MKSIMVVAIAIAAFVPAAVMFLSNDVHVNTDSGVADANDTTPVAPPTPQTPQPSPSNPSATPEPVPQNHDFEGFLSEYVTQNEEPDPKVALIGYLFTETSMTKNHDGTHNPATYTNLNFLFLPNDTINKNDIGLASLQLFSQLNTITGTALYKNGEIYSVTGNWWSVHGDFIAILWWNEQQYQLSGRSYGPHAFPDTDL